MVYVRIVSRKYPEGLKKRRFRSRRTNRLDFISPGDGGRFLQHGRHRAVLILAELNGMLDGLLIQLPSEEVHNFQFGPDRRRRRSTLPRADHLERLQLLPLLPEDSYDVG